MIITEQRSGVSGVYWIAYISSSPDNYSVGSTEQKAIEYLEEAVSSQLNDQ